MSSGRCAAQPGGQLDRIETDICPIMFVTKDLWISPHQRKRIMLIAVGAETLRFAGAETPIPISEATLPVTVLIRVVVKDGRLAHER